MENTRTVDELRLKLDRMKEEMDGASKTESVVDEKKALAYNKAFWEHMHTGIPENALKEGSDGSGSYTVPDTYEKQLVEGLSEKNVLREIGTTVTTTQRLRIPRIVETGAAEWIPENSFIACSDFTIGETIIDAHKIGTSVLITDELLEDSGFDLEEYLNRVFTQRIGECEADAFINGDGVGKPLGLLSQAPVGAVTAKSGELQLDDVIDLMYSVRLCYRDNAVWLMSEDAYRELRKIKNFDGRLLWTSNLAEGEPEKLFNHRLYVSKYLPDVATGAKSVLFGNFSYFWIGDRGKRTVKRLSERYADKGAVGFLATQRVDAALLIPEAVKVLQIKE